MSARERKQRLVIEVPKRQPRPEFRRARTRTAAVRRAAAEWGYAR